MKKPKLILYGVVALLLISITSCEEKTTGPNQTDISLTTISKEDRKHEAWQMEEQYWSYVEKNDTIAYKKLWHNDFIGYPSFGDGVSNKNKIADWIPGLHKDKSRKVSYELNKKAVNVIDDVVIIFYDVDEIWTDEQNNIVEKITLKLTHTWKKYENTWLILGGMAASK